MKTILILLLFTTIRIYSQVGERQIITLDIDTSLAIKGAYDYNDTPVLDIRFAWVTSFENGNEWGVFAEYAHLTPDYFDFGFVYNRSIPIFGENIETLGGVELSMIVRQFKGYETQKAFVAYGVNGIVRFHLSESFSLNTRANLCYRSDLAKHYNKDITFDILGDSAVKLSGMIGTSVYF